MSVAPPPRWRSIARAADVSRRRIAVSILAGTAALGSAVGLAAVAAWLIARAAGMPSPADLAIAAVAVRTFGVGRGVFRYLERLASHDTALRASVELRARVYDAVARSGGRDALTLRRGDVVARLGGDVDAVTDIIVRAIVPLGVAVSVSAIATAISLAVLPSAGFVLLACLLLAGLGSAALSWREARLAADAGAKAHAAVAAEALASIEHGTEHRLWGTGTEAAIRRRSAEAQFEQAIELAARPAALGSAIHIAASGIALIGGIGLGVAAANAGQLLPTSAAIVALLPLAAFEAVGAVPSAITHIFRARASSVRLAEIAGDLDHIDALRPMQRGSTPVPHATLTIKELSVAWPGMEPTQPVTATVEPGGALGIVGRSGVGKSTLLLALAGVRGPASGTVLIDGIPASGAHTGTVVALTPEDAHLFGTSIVENLRVARGDVSPAEATAALVTVGLGPWLASLPEGLETLIGTGGGTVSGGERRRLLLARALLSPAPIHLIDEPAEHLDADGVDALRAAVLGMRAKGHSVVIVTHDMGILDVVDEVVSLDA
jgi:ATP-binding cassette subfamily C protein CydC